MIQFPVRLGGGLPHPFWAGLADLWQRSQLLKDNRQLDALALQVAN